MGAYKNESSSIYKPVDVDASKVSKMLNDLEMEKAMPKKDRKKILRDSTKPIRKAVQSGIKSSVANDPRKAVQGVKSTVYRDGMGANVSLHDPKQSRSSKIVRASITRTGGASGIIRHRTRSRDTERIDSYWGKDRAFILRFLNEGTAPRSAFSQHVKTKSGATANRGAISARDFFRRSVDGAKVTAEQYLVAQLEAKIIAAAKK